MQYEVRPVKLASGVTSTARRGTPGPTAQDNGVRGHGTARGRASTRNSATPPVHLRVRASNPMVSKSFLKAGHTPTLAASFLYFDLSFMVWVLLGPLGVAIAKDF